MKFIASLIVLGIILAPCSMARAADSTKADKIIVIVKVPADQQNGDRD